MNEFATTDFEDKEPGGSTAVTSLPVNNTMGLNDPLLDDMGRTVGNQTLYSTTADKFNSVPDVKGASGLAGLKQFVTDNKEWLAGAGALAGIYGGGSNADKKTGYQGVIPTLSASRSMIAAPPTRAQGYRPGAGGIDYGGDVSYKLAPGMDPYANLSGISGSAAGANLTTTAGLPGLTPPVVTTTTKPPIVTPPGVTPPGVTPPGITAPAVNTDWRKGLTPQQVTSQINQWLLDHPYASQDQIAAAMKQFDVKGPELQAALAQSNFSDAMKYALTSGSGFAEVNANIQNWVAQNPYATNAEIQAIMKASGVSDADIARGLNAMTTSAGKEAAIINDMGLDQYYTNINKFIEDQNRDTATDAAAEEAAREAAKQAAGVSNADIAAAEKFLATEAGKVALAKSYLPDITGMAESDIFKLYDAQRDAGFTDQQLRDAAAQKYGQMSDTDWNYIKTQAGYAQGGEIAMAKGRYLQGGTDGMADELPARIGQDQPAALSHGEFVIPADVVSHMGNGNSDAGAKKLYQMMDKIRMARTGTKKQGKKINPDKFMPGGLAQAYASGGTVKKFETGGLTTANKNASMGISGVESNLSNWAGPYVTNMLGQGQALANMPYQAYMGPLTSGESPLQTSAFNTAAGLQTPASIGTAATTAGDIASTAKNLSYTPTTSPFDTAQMQNYMNPYLKGALEPQLEEARRQSQITQQQNAGKMTQAGAFGGGRQAILDAETQRNLASTQANITGQGYSTAYDKAMAQFNADQQRKMAESQYGAGYGLQGLQTGLQAAQAQGSLGAQQNQMGLANLSQQLAAGQQQRGIESEGIAADKAQFEEARANPYKMVQYQQSLLQGLPLAAQSYQGIDPSTLTKAAQGATSVNQLLKNLGLI